MSDKDNDLDDLGLGADLDMDEFDIGAPGDPGESPDLEGRSPVEGFVAGGVSSFVDDMVGDKTQTIKDVVSKSIPSELSTETDAIVDVYSTVKDKLSEDGSKLKREAKATLREFKKFAPDEDGIANKFLTKLGGLLGDDDENSRSSGPSQAELISNEVKALMGDKVDANAAQEMFKSELNNAMQEDIKKIQAQSSLNIERIRKFMFEVSDNYYRTDVTLSLRKLQTMQELLNVTKTGFDVFKNSLNSIVKNTALPEINKIHNSELITRRLKQNVVDDLTGSIFGKDSPLELLKKKALTGISKVTAAATDTMSSTRDGLEQFGGMADMGMGPSNMIGMILADLAKGAAGKVVSKYITSSKDGSNAIYKAKDIMADPRASLKRFASKHDDMLGTGARILEAGMRDNGANFTIEKQDPGAAAYLDNRTKDSINKVIPELLSKIYSEVRTSREIAADQIPTGPGGRRRKKYDPSKHELTFDSYSGVLTTKDAILKTSLARQHKAVKLTIGGSVDTVVRSYLGDTISNYTSAELRELKAYITKYVLTSKRTNSSIFNNNAFKEGLAHINPTLAEKVTARFKGYEKEAKKYGKDSTGVQDAVNGGLAGILRTAPSFQSIAEELVDNGQTEIAIQLGYLKRTETGQLVFDRERAIANVASSIGTESVAGAAPTSGAKEAFKNAKGFTGKSKALVNTFVNNLTNEGEEQYSTGGYTKDGGKYEKAGTVHRGELVTNQTSLKKLIKSVKETDVGGIIDQVQEMVKEVTTNSSEHKVTDDKIDKLDDVASKLDKITDNTSTTESNIDKIKTGLTSAGVTAAGKAQSVVNAITPEDRVAIDVLKTVSDNYTKVISKISKLFKNKKFNSVLGNITSLASSVSKTVSNILTTAKETLTVENVSNLANKVYDKAKDLSVDDVTNFGNKIVNKAKDAVSTINTIENNNRTDLLTFMHAKGDSRFKPLYDGMSIDKTRSGIAADYVKAKYEEARHSYAGEYTASKVGELKESKAGKFTKKYWEGLSKKLDPTNLKLTKEQQDALDKRIDKAPKWLQMAYINAKDKGSITTVKETVGTAYESAKQYGSNVGSKAREVLFGPGPVNYTNFKSVDNADTGFGILKKEKKQPSIWDVLKGMDPSADVDDTVIKSNKFILDRVGYISNKDLEDPTLRYYKEKADKASGYVEGEGYVGKWDDLTDEQKDNLRFEFFASPEYSGGYVKSFMLWIKEFKHLELGSLATVSGLFGTQYLQLKEKVLSPFNKLRKEIKEELYARLTGTALKELTLEQEAVMKETFFASPEFKEGNVTSFAVWLETQGYRRNGSGIFARIKKKLSLKNILRNTRKLDRKIAGGAAKLIGKGLRKTPKLLMKIPKVGLKYGWKGVAGAGGAVGNAVTRIPGLRWLAKDKQSEPKNARKSFFGTGKRKEAKVKKKTGIIGKTLYLPKVGLKYGWKGLVGAGGAVGDAIGDTVTSIPGLGWLSKDKRPATAAVRKSFLDKIKRKFTVAKEYVSSPTSAKSYAKKPKTGIDRLLEYFKNKDTKEAKVKETKAKEAKKKSLKERFLSMFKSSDDETSSSDSKGIKKKGVISGILSKAKSLITPVTAMLAIGVGLDAMGVTFKDVVTGIKSIGSGMSTGWSYFKEALGYIKSIYHSILDIPRNIGNLLSHIPGLGSLYKDATPKLDKDGNPVTDEVTNLGAGKVAVGGMAAAYVGNKAYKLGKAIVGVAKPLFKGNAVDIDTPTIPKKGFRRVQHAKPPVVKPSVWSRLKSGVNSVGSSVWDKVKNSKIYKKFLTGLSTFKSAVIKKLGRKGASIALGKIASKLVPGVGVAILIYDFYNVVKYLNAGKSLKSAISLAMLGADLFENDIEEETTNTVDLSTATRSNVVDIATHPRYVKRISPIERLQSNNTPARPSKPITTESVLNSIKVDTGINTPKLLGDLVRDEGVVLSKYKDSLGYDTIGVGHLVDKSNGVPLKKIIGVDKDRITQPEAMAVLGYDTNRLLKQLYSKLPWLRSVPEVVQRNIANMGFNLGVGGLLKFKNSLKNIKEGDYTSTAEGLSKSKWYTQVGDRARRIVSDFSALGDQSDNISTGNASLSIERESQEVSFSKQVSSPTDISVAKLKKAENKLATTGQTASPKVEVTTNVNLDDSKHLTAMVELSTKSLDTQYNMLTVLGEISDKLDRKLSPDKKPSHSTIERFPDPAINLKRSVNF